MKKLVVFFETNQGKRIKNAIIGWGASAVLLGALFKIMHWPGAGAMLTIGMSVEAFIFAFQGTLPPHKDYYWEKLYPDLDVSPEVEAEEGTKLGSAGQKSAVEQIDEGLQHAEVGPEVIERLGSNLNKLGEHLSRLSDLTDASTATDEYSKSAQGAAESLKEMREAYAKATEAASTLSAASSEAENYREQMQNVSKNLGSLNEMYEMELKETSDHSKQLTKFYDNLSEIMANLESSADDTRKYKDEVANLAKNISQLNAVYGNMLSAMSAQHKA